MKRNVVFGIAEAAVTTICLFLLYRGLLNTLGRETLGIWSVTAAATGAASIVDIGIGRAVIRFIARSNDTPDRGSLYYGTAMLSAATFSAGIALVMYWPIAALLRSTMSAPQADVAHGLLIGTLTAFWLQNVGSIQLGTLSGLQRADLRSVVVIISQLVFLVGALRASAATGVDGVAWAAAFKELTGLVIASLLLVKVEPALRLDRARFSVAHFREMLAYGCRVQITSFTVFLLEPTTRLLMARFGAIGLVPIYDLASKSAQAARQLIVTAGQSLVPAFAHLIEVNRSRSFDVYETANITTVLAAIITFSGLAICFPALANAILGEQHSPYGEIALLMFVAWLINLLTTPAYFLGLGAGVTRDLVAGHLIMGVGNFLLGAFLGCAFGGVGVVVATAMSLIAGSLFGGIRTHRSLTGGRPWLSSRHLVTVAFMLCGIVTAETILFLLQRTRYLPWAIMVAAATFAWQALVVCARERALLRTWRGAAPASGVQSLA